MAGRIVLFGATGYTGELTAEALVARGARPVLAARNRERLAALAERLGGLEIAVADVSDPAGVHALVEGGDVMLTTVGPFARWGRPAVEAAIAAGASYIDSTGEPSWIRAVFEQYGPRAVQAACGLVTAFGYDYVPGNVAGALALRDAGEAAARLDVGYFVTGSRGGISGGTQASAAAAAIAPGFAWRDGAIRSERSAARVRSFDVAGKQRPAASLGASEHFALPRLAPGLREVDVYLGWFGPLTRPLQLGSGVNAVITKVPGVRCCLGALTSRLVKGSSGGPDAATRARSGSHCIAIAYDERGRQLAEARLVGVNDYDFTARILAWGAQHATDHGLNGAGALGPVAAFGLEEIVAGCAEAGLDRVA